MDGNSTLGRNDSYPLENFRRGTRVWIKDPEQVWTSAELLNDVTFAHDEIQLRRTDDDEVIASFAGSSLMRSITLQVVEYNISKSGLPFLCNPDILLGKDDLTALSYLHEPAGEYYRRPLIRRQRREDAGYKIRAGSSDLEP